MIKEQSRNKIMYPNNTILCLVLILIFLFMTTINSFAGERNRRNGDINNAVVKIYTVISSPDYYRPWQQRVYRGVGSGFIIKGNRILTNAHVVANQTYIEVRKNGDPKRYQAKVHNVSHEADLALLSVEDQNFFKNIRPLKLGGLPKIQQEVLVYGFPTGGDTLSITKGIVSRIEHVQYVHSSLAFLAGQIDAAINVGNSGGPVVSGGKVVGVAMQGRNDADNIGYLIPIPIVNHFMKDIEDGHYEGFPELALVTQDMESPDLKRKYGMNKDQTGVIVRSILPDSPGVGKLKKNDILLAIDNHPIADDGTVEFRPMERTRYGYFVDMHQVGDKIKLSVLRDGNVTNVTIKSNKRAAQIFHTRLEKYDVGPRYFIFGGIVFSPLSKMLLREWGSEWYSRAPKELIVELGKLPTQTGKETVLALHVLAADMNIGYHDLSQRIIKLVNGKPYKDFNEFYHEVSTSTGPYVIFEDQLKNQFVIDRQKAFASHEAILKTYQIPQDRSFDLLEKRVATVD